MNIRYLVYKISNESFQRLFVYGTLMKGEEAHDKLDGAKFLSKINTAPKYHLKEVNNNFFEMTKGNESISGELYELDNDLLKEIDSWEYDVYKRELIDLEDGTKAFAYMI